MQARDVVKIAVSRVLPRYGYSVPSGDAFVVGRVGPPGCACPTLSMTEYIRHFEFRAPVSGQIQIQCRARYYNSDVHVESKLDFDATDANTIDRSLAGLAGRSRI